MTCRCGESTRQPAKHALRRTVAGTTFTAEPKIDSCAGRGHVAIPAALIRSFQRALEAELAALGLVHPTQPKPRAAAMSWRAST